MCEKIEHELKIQKGHKGSYHTLSASGRLSTREHKQAFAEKREDMCNAQVTKSEANQRRGIKKGKPSRDAGSGIRIVQRMTCFRRIGLVSHGDEAAVERPASRVWSAFLVPRILDSGYSAKRSGKLIIQRHDGDRGLTSGLGGRPTCLSFGDAPPVLVAAEAPPHIDSFVPTRQTTLRSPHLFQRQILDITEGQFDTCLIWRHIQ